MQHSESYYLGTFPEYTRPCAVCGKQFNTMQACTVGELYNVNRVTCSDTCSQKHTRNVRRAYTQHYKRTNAKYKAWERRYNAARKLR